MTSVLFLLPYPLHRAPSQRFRVEAYFDLLKQNNITFDCHVFWDEEAWEILYSGGTSWKKAKAVMKSYVRRFFKLMFALNRYDFVFVHREAAPIGPPLFEWIIRLMRKKIIFDFDDAIWIPNISGTNRLAAGFKCFWKTRYICDWAYKVSAGNDYLADWSRRYNSRVVINPTCVDMQIRFNRTKETVGPKPVVGWTGSHSTLKYLDVVFPVLQKLEKEYNFEFLVICNEPPAFSLKSLRFIKWNEATEIDDLLRIDIGVMPLIPDAWSEGKCGFKLIQYLSLGIPAVASPVGVNQLIVEEGTNGYLCKTEEEWYKAIKLLLGDVALRQFMGRNGRQKMEKEYSVQVNAAKFLSLFSEKTNHLCAV